MARKRIHLIYGILLSVFTIITGVCLTVACIGISGTGEHPFTPEVVAAAFSGIAIPVYIFLFLAAGGLLLDLFFPNAPASLRPQRQYAVTLARLRRKLDYQLCDKAMLRHMKAFAIKRRTLRIFSITVMILCFTYFLSYGLNSNNFHQTDITESVIQAVALFLPCLLIPSACALIAAYYERHSMRQEIEFLKKAIASGYQLDVIPSDPPPKATGKWTPAVRYALIILGVGALAYGYFAGGTADVLETAIDICEECIGLG